MIGVDWALKSTSTVTRSGQGTMCVHCGKIAKLNQNGVRGGVRCPVRKRCWSWLSEVADDLVLDLAAVRRKKNGWSSHQLSRERPLELVKMVASPCCWHGETLACVLGWHLDVVKVISKAQGSGSLSSCRARDASR